MNSKFKKEKLSKHDIRINNLLNLLNKHKVLTIGEAAQMLGVSTMTIRRDCEEFDGQNVICLKNGVLFLSNTDDVTPIKKTYELEKEVNVKNIAKSAIGRYAASLIEADDMIIMDTGSTTEAIVPYIDKNTKFSLFCSNLNILNQAIENPNIRIMFSGGVYHRNAQMFESEQSVSLISGLRANKSFISAAGIHDKLGLTCMNTYEVPTKQAIIHSTENNILLVDSSKFGKVHLSYFGELPSINTIITDKGISKEWKSKIEEMGIKLIIV